MTKQFKFTITQKSKKSKARLGVIHTPHGSFETPAFYPVATQATVKTQTPDDIKKIGFKAVLANTYHLYLRPGEKVVKKMGGLHKFMNWSGPICTDSGGFQVFSLGFGMQHNVGKMSGVFPKEKEAIIKMNKNKLVKIDEQGVNFKSHLDGSWHRLTPQKSMAIQQDLGADIMFTFDECTSPLDSYEYTKKSMERTHRWAQICIKAKKRKDQALFGIVQGGEWKDLRLASAQYINSLPFDGFGIGGSLGKDIVHMNKILKWTMPLLDEKKPKHMLGIGYPRDFVVGIKQGIDLFDCVYPTRMARHGMLLKPGGVININNKKYRQDKKPILKDCSCDLCQNYSTAYLSHLFRTKEMLGMRLATTHNLLFINNLMKKIREDIKVGRI